MKKVVFLDRDGTLNVEVNYCSSVNDLTVIPEAITAVRLLKDNGFMTIIITNQSGVSRKYFSIETLDAINKKLLDIFSVNSAALDAIYVCVHHPDDNCNCRKPQTGLFIEATKDFEIDLDASYMIGDRDSDVQAGKNFGISGLLIDPNSSKQDLVFDNILSAANHIITNDKQ